MKNGNDQLFGIDLMRTQLTELRKCWTRFQHLRFVRVIYFIRIDSTQCVFIIYSHKKPYSGIVGPLIIHAYR